MVRYDLIVKRYGDLKGPELLKPLIQNVFPGKIAMVSSFGIESAVLLHMVAQVDRTVPVVFLDTGKLFGETKRYRDELTEALGLKDVRSVKPLERDEAELDPKGGLWQSNPDLCCHFRKVEPLERALRGFQAWITGRKRFHGGMRSELDALEVVDWRLKANPLANWTHEEILAYRDLHNLPAHPLEERGYTSVGCMPCTDLPRPDGGLRNGRWAGTNKTECGIHWSANGKPIRVRKTA